MKTTSPSSASASPASSASSASSSTSTSTATASSTSTSTGMTCATASATSASAPTLGSTSRTTSSFCSAASSHNSENSSSAAELQSLLMNLSTQFVTATRHHLSLGALHYQRCSYRSSTEHYQRAINFLMRREDALVRYGPGPGPDAGASASSTCSDTSSASCRGSKIKEELLVEMEKMEFYIYVLCLNNATDMDLLQRKQQQQQRQQQPSMNQMHYHIRPATGSAAFGTTGTKRPRRTTTATTTTTTTTNTTTTTTAATNLPPPRLAFCLDESDASYILDSHLRAHQVTATITTNTANNSQDQDQQMTQSTTTTIHLLKAYVMYNLALCHVALGSYAESLNLLQMVVDDGNTDANMTTGACSNVDDNGCSSDADAHIRPAELGDIMSHYQRFIRGVVKASSSSSDASSSSSSSCDDSSSSNDDLVVVGVVVARPEQ